VEKDDDFWSGAELADELSKYDGNHVADFVEEDSYSIDGRNISTAERFAPVLKYY